MQIKLKRYFLREQPSGTALDYIEPWPQVQKDPEVKTLTIDQCMTGQKDRAGQPVKKPTEMTANNEILLEPMRYFVCDNSHEHATPTGEELHRTQVYTWKLCKAIVTGIENLRQKVRHVKAYPAATTGTEEEPSDKTSNQLSSRKRWACPACEANLRGASPAHTRVLGDCKYKTTEPRPWTCPVCAHWENTYRNPRATTPGHTNIEGQCRFPVIAPPKSFTSSLSERANIRRKP